MSGSSSAYRSRPCGFTGKSLSSSLGTNLGRLHNIQEVRPHWIGILQFIGQLLRDLPDKKPFEKGTGNLASFESFE